MYCLLSTLIGQPIISLQTGQIAAWVEQPVLDIATLEVLAFMCQAPGNRQPVLVITQDIRQYAVDCIIIDNEDDLTEPNDIIRLSDNLVQRYSPLGALVATDSGHKLGTVEDYSVHLETNRVQQLHVRQSLLKALLGSSLIIDRSQIVDITPKRITVNDSTVTNPIITSESVPEV